MVSTFIGSLFQTGFGGDGAGARRLSPPPQKGLQSNMQISPGAEFVSAGNSGTQPVVPEYSLFIEQSGMSRDRTRTLASSINEFIDIQFPKGIPDTPPENGRACRDFLRSILVLSRQEGNHFPPDLVAQIDQALRNDRNLLSVTNSVRDYMNALTEFASRRPRL